MLGIGQRSSWPLDHACALAQVTLTTICHAQRHVDF